MSSSTTNSDLVRITVKVNGVTYTHEIPARMLLVHYIRDVLGLTGTHVGCDTSNCAGLAPLFSTVGLLNHALSSPLWLMVVRL
jgi:carbon-monoxide dehydrogenase small subunit